MTTRWTAPFALALVGCGAILGIEDRREGVEDNPPSGVDAATGPDPNPNDASSVEDSSGVDPDAGPPADGGDPPRNLLPGGDFEGTAGCGGWSATGPVTLTVVTTPTNNGEQACRACLGASATTFAVQSPTVVVSGPGAVRGSVFVRRATTVPGNVVFTLDNIGVPTVTTGFSTPNRWQELSRQSNPLGGTGGVKVHLVIELKNPDNSAMSAGTCVFLDDAAITKSP